ncbi:MAG: hypothetical protein ACXVAK_13560 [Vulcanimicrobiaceae bacterium]
MLPLAIIRIMLLLLAGIAGEIVISMVAPPLTGRDYAIGASVLVGCILTYAWIWREHRLASRVPEQER